MKACLLIVLLLINHLSMASWHSSDLKQSYSHLNASPNSEDTSKGLRITYNIIQGAQNTYGYDILVDGKLMVHQPTIPAVSGQKGFTKKEDAEKVAQLVVSKVKAGVMPPTVTRQEMEKLGVSLK